MSSNSSAVAADALLVRDVDGQYRPARVEEVLSQARRVLSQRVRRGADGVDWLADMGYYEMPVERHPLREGVRDNTNHYVTGRDGGRDIDLRRFALEGMTLCGPLSDIADGALRFAPRLRELLDHADSVYNGINASIDKHIAERAIAAPPGSPYRAVWEPPAERTALTLAEADIGSVMWCIGFAPDFSWLDAPVFDERGNPLHQRGITQVPGLYFLGLPWLHTWGSGRFAGVDRDARHVAERIEGLSRAHAQRASGPQLQPV